MIRILVLITLCLPPSALANLATCTSDNVAAGGWLCHVSCTDNDYVFTVAARPAWTLRMSICALAPRATIAPLRRPQLVVSCTHPW